MSSERYRVAVLASGGGSNLQALLDACGPESGAAVVLVMTNGEVGATARARAAGIPVHVLDDPEDGKQIRAALEAHRTDLVVLAGYIRLVPAGVVHAYRNRMINIHPALLPAFGGKGMYGLRVHRAVLEAGSGVSGPTVHVVTAEYDRGTILAQWPVPVTAGDTPDTLRARVLAAEHRLLPAVVLAAARHRRLVRLTPDLTDFGTMVFTEDSCPER